MMDAKTLEALHGSIAKWQAIVDSTDTDRGSDNCPLCKLFLNQNDECGGCPVRGKTGKRNCNGSPYRDYLGERTTENAQVELDFLKSLVPK